MKQADLIAHLSHSSRYVENAIKHVFLAELFQTLWQHDPTLQLQVFIGEIDAFGHDIVLVVGSVTRHIQFKASHINATAQSTNINIALSQTPAGCTVWMFYELTSLQIRHYLFFGSPVGQPPPDLSRFKSAKHHKPNSKGIRTERPAIRDVPKSKFVRMDSLAGLIQTLFNVSIE